jgi:hypothetical protein
MPKAATMLQEVGNCNIYINITDYWFPYRPRCARVHWLSQMSKELKEEALIPGSELHFAPDGSIIGVRSQDVEGDAAKDSKVLRAVILSGSRVIFVEDYVEWPV